MYCTLFLILPISVWSAVVSYFGTAPRSSVAFYFGLAELISSSTQRAIQTQQSPVQCALQNSVQLKETPQSLEYLHGYLPDRDDSSKHTAVYKMAPAPRPAMPFKPRNRQCMQPKYSIHLKHPSKSLNISTGIHPIGEAEAAFEWPRRALREGSTTTSTLFKPLDNVVHVEWASSQVSPDLKSNGFRKGHLEGSRRVTQSALVIVSC